MFGLERLFVMPITAASTRSKRSDIGVRLEDAAPWSAGIREQAARSSCRGTFSSACGWAVARDGRLAAVAHEDGITLYDLKTGNAVRQIKDSGVAPFLAFSDDGRSLVACKMIGEDIWNVESYFLVVWNVASGRPQLGGRRIKYMPPCDYYPPVALSPDGRWLAVNNRIQPDSTEGAASIQLWEVASGSCGPRLIGTNSRGMYLQCLALRTDGRTLAGGRAEEELLYFDHGWHRQIKNVSLWDITSGRELQSFDGHKDDVRSLAFSADGSRLASCKRRWHRLGLGPTLSAACGAAANTGRWTPTFSQVALLTGTNKAEACEAVTWLCNVPAWLCRFCVSTFSHSCLLSTPNGSLAG